MSGFPRVEEALTLSEQLSTGNSIGSHPLLWAYDTIFHLEIDHEQ